MKSRRSMVDYPPKKVLQFLIDVLDEAERASPDALRVIPVVVKDDLARLVPVIFETCRFAGHPFVRAETAVDGIKISGPSDIDSTLRSMIEAITLDPTGSGTPQGLVISDDKGCITVRLGDNTAPTNPGDRNQLGLLTALLDPDVRTHDVAVIAYDETSMSDDSKQRMWDFLLDELKSLGGNCKTLVVFIGCADFDYERHCREGDGARWAFQDGDVRWRQRWHSDLSQITRISEREEPLILMLGAGVAASSGLPLGNQLRDNALARLVPDLANSGADYRQQAAEFFQQVAAKNRLMTSEEDISQDEFIERLTLERVLREEARTCAPHEILPTLREFSELQASRLDHAGSAVLDLRELLRLRRRLVLLTVNFDQLLEHDTVLVSPTGEDPYSASTPTKDDLPAIRMFACDEDFQEFPAYYEAYRVNGGVVPYVKLHGTIDRPETVRANVDVTLPGLSESAARLLRSLIPDPGTSVDWVYVGCSMRDPDVTDITRTQEFSHRAREAWVSPLVDPHVEHWVSQIRQPAWRAVGLPESMLERTVTQTADVFFKHLRGCLTEPRTR